MGNTSSIPAFSILSLGSKSHAEFPCPIMRCCPKSFSVFQIVSVSRSINENVQTTVHRLEQIQHAIQIDCLPDVDLVLWLGHVIQQKFQNHGTSQPSAFDFEIRKTHGEVIVPNVLNADKARIGHGFGEPIPLIATGGGAMVIYAVFSQTLSADILIAAFSLGAAEPAAFVAEKLCLPLLCICQGVHFVKCLVQPKIRQHLCGG